MVSHGNTKGEAIEALVKSRSLPLEFNRIIMIDDKQSHLNHVGQSVKHFDKNDVEFIPVLCTYPQSVRQYNSTEAVHQLEAFLLKWRNDSVIAQLISHDRFTRQFLKECASGASQQKGQCELLLKTL